MAPPLSTIVTINDMANLTTLIDLSCSSDYSIAGSTISIEAAKPTYVYGFAETYSNDHDERDAEISLGHSPLASPSDASLSSLSTDFNSHPEPTASSQHVAPIGATSIIISNHKRSREEPDLNMRNKLKVADVTAMLVARKITKIAAEQF